LPAHRCRSAAYVDLNPVRATIAETPEDSDYTSIQRRIRALQVATEPTPQAPQAEQGTSPTQPPELYPFVGGEREGLPAGLPFYLDDYLELVNWTGRAVRDDKRGAIADDLPPILERIGASAEAWLQLSTRFEQHFCGWVGQPGHVEEACQLAELSWARGMGACRRLFESG